MDLMPDITDRDIRAEFVECDPRLGEVFDAVMAIEPDEQGKANEVDVARELEKIARLAAELNLSACSLILSVTAAWHKAHPESTTILAAKVAESN